MEGQKGRRRRRTTTTIEDLGDDLTVEILRSLPLSSIISCLLVCKRWRTVISCSALLMLSKSINVVAILYREFNGYTYVERGQGGRRQRIFSEPPVSIYFPRRDYDDESDRITVSCNGLFFTCYYFYFYERPWLRFNLVNQCFISNPWTKEFVRIPGPTKACKYPLYGLAFENNSSHNKKKKLALYKIVMAHRVSTYEKESPYKFEMYSSDKNEWQWLPEAPRPKHHSYCKSDQIAAYCNRVLYWQCRRWKKEHALMFNVETESFGHLDLPGADDDDEKEEERGLCKWMRKDDRVLCSRLTECNGKLHFIRIGSTSSRLIIWKMTMSGGWLILYNVDLRGAVESNLDLFPDYGPKRGRAVDLSGFLGIITITMSCEGDDKVLLEDSYSRKRIVSYDLKKGVFELVYKYDWHSCWKFFRYTPTTKFISER